MRSVDYIEFKKKVCSDSWRERKDRNLGLPQQELFFKHNETPSDMIKIVVVRNSTLSGEFQKESVLLYDIPTF